MNRNLPIRLMVVVAFAATTFAVSMSAPSGAAGKVSCGKEASGKPSAASGIITVKATLSACINLAPSAKSTSKVNTNTGKATSTTTWANGKGTTVQSVTYKAATKAQGPGKCPKGTSRTFVTAKVTGGSGAALKAIPKGSIGKSSVCVNSKTSLGSLEPGTRATF